MAIVYEWNPFQERIANDIKQEVIKTAAQTNRVEWLPRAAPFFSKNFKLWRQGTATPLVLGVDYCFGHTFERFIMGYQRNCFGSVIMLKPVAGEVLLADYSTIGGPFVLDQLAFATLLANIVNSPRVADWADLTNVPAAFPTDPHDHPVSQTYDYAEMMTSLRSLILSITDQGEGDTGVTVKQLLEEHMRAPLIEAHFGDSGSIGLDLVPNMSAASNADLAGSSANKLVTVAVLKEAFRQLTGGTLAVDPGVENPVDPGVPEVTVITAPKALNISSVTQAGVTTYTLTVTGGESSDEAPITYSLFQSGGVALTFSKTTGVAEAQAVTFTAPTVTNNTQVVISAVTVTSLGGVSPATATTVTITTGTPPSVPTTLNVPATVLKGSTGNVLTVTGSTASGGGAVTYSLTQAGGSPVTFSKTSGIAAGEQVTFTAPEVTSDTPLIITAVAVDSQGNVSPPKAANVTVLAVPTVPGTPYGGGFYAGRMKVAGVPYALIVAPKNGGQSRILLQIATGAYAVIDTPSTWDGAGNTAKMVAQSGVRAAAEFCKNLKINGHTDWFLPAKDQLELLYRAFKPNTTLNWTAYGANPSSDPVGLNYTPTAPAQTNVTAFKTGGSEAFDASDVYWSSTEYTDAEHTTASNMCTQQFHNGQQHYELVTGDRLVRAVRMIKL